MSASHRHKQGPRPRRQLRLSRSGRLLVRRFIQDRSGNVVVLAGIMLPVLIGGMGLGAEAGYWYFQQRKLQHAADVASYAAGVRLKKRDEEDVLDKVALHIARSSGYNGSNEDVANHPPTSGSFAGDSDAVEVILTETIPRAFSSVFLKDDLSLSGRAVAAIVNDQPACVLALSATASDAVKLHGNVDVNLSGCHIAANSNADDAFSMHGSAELTVDCIHTVGGADVRPKATMTECDEPDEGASPVKDPYDDLTPPDVTGPCVSSGPGRYCGGMDLKDEVELESGVYIIEGDLKINSKAKVSGTDVTFFLTDGATVQINGSAEVDLKAPTSGPYAGVLFFGDPDDDDVSVKINGNSNGTYQGAFYIPAGEIEFAGGSGGGGDCIQLIGDTVRFTGGSQFTADCKNAGLRNIDVAGGLRIVE